MRGYRAIGYVRGEAPLGYREMPEVTIEYDTEVDDEEPAREPHARSSLGRGG